MAERKPLADDPIAMAIRYQSSLSRFWFPIRGHPEWWREYDPWEIGRQLDRGGWAVLNNSLFVKETAQPPLVSDPDNYEFFRAVVQREDGIIDIDPHTLDALRRYVLDNDGRALRAPPVAEAS